MTTTATETATEAVEPTTAPEAAQEPTEAPEAAQEPQDATEPDTFPREYVEKLRKEAADYRDRAKKTDDLAHRLHDALVASTGRLADPTDLPYDETHLEDADALGAALDDLLARKPHLAARTPRGDIGQGATGDSTEVNLASILRAHA